MTFILQQFLSISTVFTKIIYWEQCVKIIYLHLPSIFPINVFKARMQLWERGCRCYVIALISVWLNWIFFPGVGLKNIDVYISKLLRVRWIDDNIILLLVLFAQDHTAALLSSSSVCWMFCSHFLDVWNMR